MHSSEDFDYIIDLLEKAPIAEQRDRLIGIYRYMHAERTRVEFEPLNPHKWAGCGGTEPRICSECGAKSSCWTPGSEEPGGKKECWGKSKPFEF